MSPQSLTPADLPSLRNPRHDLKDRSLADQVLYFGAAMIEGEFATELLEQFAVLAPYLRQHQEDWAGFPESPIRGRFVSRPGSARVGINYGPEMNIHFKNAEDALRFEKAYGKFLAITHEIISSLFAAYALPCLEKTHVECTILTASYYLGHEANAPGLPGLKEHEDFGLATVGVADQPGLEYLHPEGGWKPVVPNQVLFHVGEWARRIFRTHQIDCNPFLHRVVDQNEGRMFLGMFYNPSFGTRLESDFFNLPTRELSFLEFINQSSSYK